MVSEDTSTSSRSAADSSGMGSNSLGATLNGNNITEIDDDAPQRALLAEVAMSVFVAVLLAIALLLLLCVRSKSRDNAVRQARRTVKLDVYDPAVRKDSRKTRIIQKSIDVQQYRIVNPPQFDRVIPNVLADGHDWRAEAQTMLQKIRNALPKSFGQATKRMSMRTAVHSMSQMLDPVEVENFLRIYEAVALGIHQAVGTEGDVTKDELRFMSSYFYSVIMKEL